MVKVLILLALSGCAQIQGLVVVEPIEAVRLCGSAGVKTYNAMNGSVECK